MPTVTVSIVSLAASSGVTNPTDALTDNNSGSTMGWVTGTATPKTMDFNTDAASVLPANAIITHWKVRFDIAFTWTAGTTTIQFRPGPNHALQTVDHTMTSGFTTFLQPASPPEGFAVSSFNTRDDFLVARMSVVSLDASYLYLYTDYFNFDITYALPTGANAHILMGDF